MGRLHITHKLDFMLTPIYIESHLFNINLIKTMATTSETTTRITPEAAKSVTTTT